MNPAKITGDQPPQPFLSTGDDNSQIAHRLIAKEVLRQAFWEMGQRWHHTSNDTHGEFGDLTDLDRLLNGLGGAINNINTGEITDCLARGTQLNASQLNNDIQTNLATSTATILRRALNSEDPIAKELANAGMLPLFGMPTRVRNLNHGKTQRQNRLQTIDRDVELSISNFAPGATRTKDKYVYKASAIGGRLSHAQGHRWFAGSLDDLTCYISVCDSCNQITKFPTPPEEAICSTCSSSLSYVKTISPESYYTDGRKHTPNSSDARGDYTSVETFVDNLRGGKDSIICNSQQKYITSGNILKLNRGLQREGFKLYEKNSIKLFGKDFMTQNIDSHKILSIKGREDDESSEYYLLAERTTNVLTIKLNSPPKGILTSMQATGEAGALESAYFSAATLIVNEVARRLDISATEIELAKIGSTHGSPEIIFCDKLLNGSGFVEWISKNFRDILIEISNSTTTCCSSACYKCLLSYDNRFIHSLMDWQLGQNLINMFLEPDFDCGLFSLDCKWLTSALREAERFTKAFDGIQLITDNDLPVVHEPGRNTLYIIGHGLWSASTPQNSILHQTYSSLRTSHPDSEIRLMDEFNLRKRMSWVWTNRVNLSLISVSTEEPARSAPKPRSIIDPDTIPADKIFKWKQNSYRKLDSQSEISHNKDYLITIDNQLQKKRINIHAGQYSAGVKPISRNQILAIKL